MISDTTPPLYSPGDRVTHLLRPGTIQSYISNTLLVYVLLDDDEQPCLAHQQWIYKEQDNEL
jgi:hypothetical protein